MNNLPTDSLLSVQNLSLAGSGKVPRINQATFTLQQDESVTLIGPNGSGKSTLLRLISGELKPNEGEILFQGTPLSAIKPQQHAVLDAGRTGAGTLGQFDFCLAGTTDIGDIDCLALAIAGWPAGGRTDSRPPGHQHQPIDCERAKIGALALAVIKSASIMRDNLPGESMKNDACFVSHNRQNRLPSGSQLPLFLLLLNRSFQAPR